jgi:hypothetical protein
LYGKLSKIKVLKIIHIPRIKEIMPLSKLESLEKLEISILPSQNNLQHIESLKPLRNLMSLRSLVLHGIAVDDGSLEPIASCPRLNEFRSGNLFSMHELLSLKAVKPEIKGTFFAPLVELPYTRCSKCGSLKVILSGVVKYAIQCPKCHKNRVQEHLDEWQKQLTKIIDK